METQTKRRLLVVDDDRKLAGLIRDYLTPMGYEVELRYNGPDGLVEALAFPYEAVILDVMMPGMDGFGFQISLPSRGNDELGNLGHALQSMAGRLDHLVSGQKRFLGDAAHELCAPLARLRTGLGILEMKLGETERSRLSSIEADAQELATLIEEILEFSRAGHRTPRMQPVPLEPLIEEVAAREGGENAPELRIPPGLTATADPSLLGRALGNLIRNARVHAGPNAKVVIEGAQSADFIHISVTDDGPGVSHDELPRLFEPFYRPDRSRSRDTGGSGLGLAIVYAAVEACGGQTVVSLPPAGGFVVTIRLRRNLLEEA